MFASRIHTTVARTAASQARAFSTGPGEAYIVAAARTPIGASFNGSFAQLTAPALGSAAIKGALERAGIPADAVQETLFGNVISANMGQAPARQATLGAGLSLSTPCTTINKVCASGTKATMMAAQHVMLGSQDIVLAGGMESMSQVPYYLDKGRTGYGYGHGQVTDGVIKDGLWDAYNDFHMGMCGEKCSTDMNITREEQDEYALESYRRAAAAHAAGKFTEIVPVSVPQRKGDPKVIDTDDLFVKDQNLDRLTSLRPAFKKDGTVTAGNASTLNDGAAAIIVVNANGLERLGVKPLARIRGFADAAQRPEDFATAPALAVPKALKMAGVEAGDIDYHEINEAFSVVALANMRLLNLDHARVNVNGGAVSLGHPIGCSGARIITTLLSVLEQNDGTLGTVSICNGGGGASAMVIERL